MEKNEIKINLVTILLIVAIIAIGVMGYFMYQTSVKKAEIEERATGLQNEKMILEEENADLEDQKEKMQDTINELENTIKKANIIDDTTYTDASSDNANTSF